MSHLSLLPDSEHATLTGSIERIIFHNEDNGYTVFRLLPQGTQDAVGVVGHMGSPQAGVQVKVQGKWVTNARFGRQLQLESYEEIMPASTEGIRLYLASGLIKGVRSSLANRIVDAFGVETIRVLDDEPDRLLDVAGVG
ncbi:MAG: ATP-dependent RecD-like DNA helicase, partial [Desulfovibrionaceae bacterium]